MLRDKGRIHTGYSKLLGRLPRILPPSASFALAIAFFVFGSHMAVGQATSTMLGSVVDPQDLAVPNAEITITNADTGLVRHTLTNSTGNFTFPQLPPGSYRLRALARGFKTLNRDGIILEVNTPAVVPIQLQVGASNEVVQVYGDENHINLVDATMGNPFTETQISQLPLEGRNVVGLLSLQPGVTFIGNVDQQGNTDDYRNGSVNGGRSDQANVTLDGVDVNDQLNGLAFTSVLRVTLDSVQEFRVTTTNANADEGRSSGAQVALLTKSGSNAFHGSVYEFNRNTNFSANDYFNNAAGVPRPQLIRNVFGTSLGGPIRKNRLFFFLTYEGRRDARAESDVRIVPSMLMRQGSLLYVNTAGDTVTLSPSDIQALDPAHIGPNQAVLDIFQQYPKPNDTTVGDGLNTEGFRFNSPLHLKYDTYIARLDYSLTENGKHQLSWRGNLQNDHSNEAAQFPGQPPSIVDLNNSKGFAASYTAILRPNLVNVLRWGYTRQGIEAAGVSTSTQAGWDAVDPLTAFTRSDSRILPVHNIVDNISWAKGSHDLKFGFDYRIVRNDQRSFLNSFDQFSANNDWLLGTGVDLQPSDISGDETAFRLAMVAELGLFTRALASYNYDRNGEVLPSGSPVRRLFGASEYEPYVQDSWRIKSNVTLTYGLRYSLASPPYELHGEQVAPSFSLDQWFRKRGTNGAMGIPSNASPPVSIDLAGPANGRKGYYNWDKRNFEPRIAIAYSPRVLPKLFGGAGKTSLRAGVGLFYDHIGSALAATFDAKGSFGLSTLLTNPSGVLSATTAPRFTSFANLPTQLLPPAPPGGFPATPPRAGQPGSFAITYSIDDAIRTPYSTDLNASLQRQFKDDVLLSLSYVGKISRHLLAPIDLAMPVNLADPASGDNYFSAATKLVHLADQKTPVASVPSLPYWENLYPSIAQNSAGMVSVMNGRYGFNLPANTQLTATQAMYLLYTQVYGPDYTSALVDIDVNCGDISQGVFPCSKFGPYSFFNDQYSSLQAFSSIMPASYHALQASVTKHFKQGLQFDFNYTFSRSVDWTSQVERNQHGNDTLLINSWSPQLRQAVSDFDIRHSINANYIAQLPFGALRHFNPNNRFLNSIISGWQLSGIARLTSGLPIGVANGSFYPTNWDEQGNATRIGPVRTGTTKTMIASASGETPGVDLFPDPSAALASYRNTFPGQVGTRNDLRGDGYFSWDSALDRTFRIAEHQRLQFRWEVFNTTNSARFDVKSLTLDLGSGRSNFGKYSSTLTSPRVMQFGLRYEF